MTTHLEKGIILHKERRHSEAIAEYKKSLDDPNESRTTEAATRHISIAYYELNNFEAAKTHAKHLINNGGGTAQSYYLLGSIQLNLNELEEAQGSFAGAISKGFDATKALKNIIICKIKQQKFFQAMQLAQELSEKENTKQLGDKLIEEIQIQEQKLKQEIEKKSSNELNLKSAKANHKHIYKKACKAAHIQAWGRAEVLYKQALKLKNNNSQYLGELCAVQTYLGKNIEAIKTGNKAISIDRNNASIYINLALAYRNNRQDLKSLELLENALKIDPNHLIGLSNKVGILHRLGYLVDAKRAADTLFATGQDSSDVRNNLANIYLTTGHTKKAIVEAQKSLTLNISNTAARITLSRAYISLREFDNALYILSEGLSTVASSPEINLAIANVFAYTIEDAKTYQFAKAAEILNLNKDAQCLAMTAKLYIVSEKLSEALRITSKLVKLEPDNSEIMTTHAIACARLKLNEEAKLSFQKSLEIENDPITRSQYIFSLAYQSWAEPEEYKKEAIKYGLLAQELTREVQIDVPKRISESKLRIGFLSGDLRSHSIGWFMKSLLDGLRNEDCETIAFSTYTVKDSMAELLESKFSEWYDVEELLPESLGRLIANSQLDALFDLSGHTEHHRLITLALKPCPLICHYLGFPGTLGMNEVDYFIGDEHILPSINHNHFVEKIGILNRGYLAYSPPSDSPEAIFNHELFDGNNRIVYCSFNNPGKITSSTMKCWSKILALDTTSKLILKGSSYSDEGFKDEFFRLLKSHDISKEQIALLPRTKTTYEHLNAYNGIHCSLDTIGFTGGTTTCEALWMGVPVITLPNTEMKTRISTSSIQSAGCPEFIAKDEEDYIHKAYETGLAFKNNPILKMQLHEKVKKSNLLDGDSLARAMIEFVKKAMKSQ